MSEKMDSRAAIAEKFLAETDYYPCEANAQLFDEYFNKHYSVVTLENLREAYERCRHKLCSRPAPAPPVKQSPRVSARVKSVAKRLLGGVQ